MAEKEEIWEVYKDKRGEFRWRRRSRSGDVISASTEGYTGRSSCIANADRHGRNGNPKGLGKDDTWQFYKDKRGEFRWRRRSKSSQIVGASALSYSDYQTCRENAELNGYSVQDSPEKITSVGKIKNPIGMTDAKRNRILEAIATNRKHVGKY